MGAAEDWAEALASWAIPPEIMARAPEDPWAWPVGAFVRATERAVDSDTPSTRRAREALAGGGRVLDVGCGAGAASLPLVPPADSVTGVDGDAEMLAAFSAMAEARGVEHHAVAGRWPDVMDEVAAADVGVCHHVLYNVPDLAPFVAALADHARRRFVIEMTAEHPRAWSRPLWRELHGIDRPTKPTVDDALVVIRELGLDVRIERWRTELWAAGDPALVESVRRSLCLPADRDADVARALERHRPPAYRTHVTIWWDAPGTM